MIIQALYKSTKVKNISPQKKVTRLLLKTTHSLDDHDKDADNNSGGKERASKDNIDANKEDLDENDGKPDCDPGTEGCNFLKWFPR